MRWRSANKRRKAKLYGPSLKNSTVRRIALCNRFAASDAGRLAEVRMERGLASFKSLFYYLKDRLMDQYGRPKGYALQEWTSPAYDGHGDWTGLKASSEHQHILECVKLGRLMFHRPTGHFSFYNSLTEYYKKTVGFEVIEKLCVETLKGKKRVTRNVPTESEARAALAWLMRRYGALYHAPATPKPNPRVITGDYYSDYLNAQYRRRREERRAEVVECHFCLNTKCGAEMTKVGAHELCGDCCRKIAPSVIDDSIPF